MPPKCGVLPHYLEVSLQQQVHSVLNENVTTKNRYVTICCCVTWHPYWSRAVSFLMLLLLGSVPASSSGLTHSRWPYWAEQCSTVSLSPLVRFTFGFGKLGLVSRRTLEKELYIVWRSPSACFLFTSRCHNWAEAAPPSFRESRLQIPRWT